MRRSMLFMPGNNAGMLLNADFLGADSIILDLEDAVSTAEKDAARILVRNAISTLEYTKSEVIVRINPLDSPFYASDINEIVPTKPSMLMLPKVSSREDVLAYDELVTKREKECGMEEGTIKFIPLIETALGIENAYAIASSHSRVVAVLLGAEDLSADLGCKRTKEGNEIAYSRGRIVCAAKAAKIACYDTPFTDVNDDEGLKKDAALAKSLGFTGKASISPRHVNAINTVFSPTMAEIEYASEVLRTIKKAKAEGLGVVSLKGKMIDAPIVARAEQVLQAARELGVDIDE